MTRILTEAAKSTAVVQFFTNLSDTVMLPGSVGYFDSLFSEAWDRNP
jgi:hypothetical protein